MSKMEERSPERPYGILAEFAQLQKEREGGKRELGMKTPKPAPWHLRHARILKPCHRRDRRLRRALPVQCTALALLLAAGTRQHATGVFHFEDAKTPIDHTCYDYVGEKETVLKILRGEPLDTSGGDPFVLTDPADSTCDWGLGAMRVWARPDHLWVLLIDKNNNPCTSFRWAPGETCSVPLPSSSPRRTSSSKRMHLAHRPQRSKSRSMHRPPRRIALAGERDWGDQIDREVIERRAHGVRGHLRWLPPDWRASAQAGELARSFSLTLPDGYTFVRPHVRGGQSNDGVEGPRKAK